MPSGWPPIRGLVRLGLGRQSNRRSGTAFKRLLCRRAQEVFLFFLKGGTALVFAWQKQAALALWNEKRSKGR